MNVADNEKLFINITNLEIDINKQFSESFPKPACMQAPKNIIPYKDIKLTIDLKRKD